MDGVKSIEGTLEFPVEMETMQGLYSSYYGEELTGEDAEFFVVIAGVMNYAYERGKIDEKKKHNVSNVPQKNLEKCIF